MMRSDRGLDRPILTPLERPALCRVHSDLAATNRHLLRLLEARPDVRNLAISAVLDAIGMGFKESSGAWTLFPTSAAEFLRRAERSDAAVTTLPRPTRHYSG
jgi:hypothetical protein